MRILHLLNHSLPMQSGYVYRTAAIVAEQTAKGWETLQLTSGKQVGSEEGEDVIDGIRYHRTRSPRGGVSNIPIYYEHRIIGDLAKRTLDLSKQFHPDILHAHSPALNGLAALRAARQVGIPTVYEKRSSWEDAAAANGRIQPNGIRYRATRLLETRVLHGVDAIVTICDGLWRDVVDRGVPAAKVTVIPNGVDAERFAASCEPDYTLRQELGLQGTTVVGFVGTLYFYEGLDLLIDAVPALLAKRPDIRVLIVGSGPEEGRLRERIRRASLDNVVVLTGRVPHSVVDRYYSLIDILVYPRRSMPLTELVTPLKPLEAMSQGKLIIASDVGGMRELIENGTTGSLFCADNVRSLADTILDLVRNPNSWDQRRKNAREYVERNRKWDMIVKKYERVYSSILA